jgi:excinuclease ABC subunit C
MSLSKQEITTQLTQLPNEPGIYKYFDSSNQLLYVGKAKNIKKRVTNYFQPSERLDRKTQALVSQIHAIEYNIVNSEYEALLLENNLIKSHQPKYNILLKDDKTFPYLCLSKEVYPRLYPTRKLILHKGEYFGPYTNVKAMYSLLDYVRKIFKIRTCSLALTPQNVNQGQFKICLEYHIKNCLGPCENRQSYTDYKIQIDQVRHILKGNYGIVKKHLNEQMLDAAKDLKFELAQFYKEQLINLEQLEQKSVIVNPELGSLEVYTLTRRENKAAVNFLKIHRGAIIQTRTIEIKQKISESDEDLIMHALLLIHSENWIAPTELLCNVELSAMKDLCKVTIPQIGDKKKLIDLSLKNALFNLYKTDTNKKTSNEIRILEQIKVDFRLKELPIHMECFDNSNLQGTNPVASMVCFKNGKPSKKDYRHFNIKTVEGPNDFASMFEIVTRRYTRLLEEQSSLPQLIVIDGGKGQLSSACEALKALGLYGKVAIVGIAKRLEEIFYPEDSEPLFLSKKSESLKVIQQMRDEAHRFAITFHRNKRSKSAITRSSLNDIEGIGPETIKKLLQQYKSIKTIKALSIEELSASIGSSKANLLYYNLHPNK